ncbi:unnamed protein product [Rotaria sordida]|uniref:Uncharacterized protein n=1 Tax=Rotaria sordida TaxID=392033 RepID=A0A819R3B9_9BILA|nr:unnamed protein product [Rotaria sordida]
MTQSFSTNWIPSKNQSMTVINTDEIARKLEAVYGIKPGSIRISTIMINNDQTNVDGRRHRRRRQLDRKKREIFADGSFNELMLTRCHKDTDSSLNSLLRSRRAPKTATTQATTAKATTTQATTAKATTAKATTAKATTAQATTAKPTTPKSAATSGK